MYRCAKTRARVIEKAEDGLMKCVLFFSLILFSLTSIDTIRVQLTAPDSAFPQIASAGMAAPGLDVPGLDIVATSGHMVLTMDEDWASSDSFWRQIKSKKKRKSRGNPNTVAAKPDPSLINGAQRSGLLTTKPGGSLFGIFSNSTPVVLPPIPGAIAGNVGRSGSGYRTLCVRLSDGYYWPVSFSTSRKQFLKDRHVCKRSCAQRVRLFVYRNPGGTPEDMVDLRGRPYSGLENAWRYREEYSSNRKCSPHPWEEASLAKHRAYAMMAKRRGDGARYITTAGLLKQRRLKRVGRARTMSTIDLEFVENSRFRRSDAGQPNRVGVGSRDFGPGQRPMALGAAAKARAKADKRSAKPQRYRRKSRKSPDWVREAFGFD